MTRKISLADKRKRDGLKPGYEMFCLAMPAGFKSKKVIARSVDDARPTWVLLYGGVSANWPALQWDHAADAWREVA
jgi:hypothetical protein